MKWDAFLNKHVIVRQTDGHLRFGTVKEVGEDYVLLTLDNGSPSYINAENIAVMEVQG
jgi:ferredoxin-fold anticodon binding domain-containing protein